MSDLYPLRLAPSWREKIWGSTNLEPLFGSSDRKIGEVWYTFEENTVLNGPWAGHTLADLMVRHDPALMGTSHQPSNLERRSAGEAAAPGAATRAGAYFPLLIKFVFTSDKLSVQGDPDDQYALEHEGGPGKTEMWYVLRADPGAAIALGLTHGLTKPELRAAAQSGEIANYLRWVEVSAGDAIFSPPGTLHSLGAGLAICEVQQNSDLTYRFYDFGRLGADGQPRPLHIDRAVEVTELEMHPGPEQPVPFAHSALEGETLVVCDYFAVERLRSATPVRYTPDPERFHLLVAIAGRGRFGGEHYGPGDVYLIPAALDPFEWTPSEPTTLLRAYVPS